MYPQSASAAAIQAERDWRHNYPAHLVRLEAAGFVSAASHSQPTRTELLGIHKTPRPYPTQESCAASVRAAVAGLAAVRSEFELVRRLEDGLDEAAAETTTERIESVVTPAVRPAPAFHAAAHASCRPGRPLLISVCALLVSSVPYSTPSSVPAAHPQASTLRSVSVQGKAAAATLAEVLSPFKEEGPPPVRHPHRCRHV